MTGGVTATSAMRQRLHVWLAPVRRAFARLINTVRRDPLPFAGSATALLGIVLLVLARGHAVPTAPGLVTPHPGRGSVVYLNPEPQSPTNPKTSPEPTQAVTTPPAASTAKPQWPIVGPVVEGYGWTYDKTAGYWYFHTAWDIEGHTGETARAAMGGTVQSVSQSPTLGEVVTVSSPDGLVETYGGLSTAAVSEGDALLEGQTVGTLGPVSGEQHGVHLHFAIRRAGQPVNPYLYLPIP